MLWSRMWSLLVNVVCACEKNVFCVFWLEIPVNVNQDKLAESVDQIFYILTVFCLVLSNSERYKDL